MPGFNSNLKLDYLFEDGTRRAIELYTSPYGAYMRLQKSDDTGQEVIAQEAALMKSKECRALANALLALAETLESDNDVNEDNK